MKKSKTVNICILIRKEGIDNKVIYDKIFSFLIGFAALKCFEIVVQKTERLQICVDGAAHGLTNQIKCQKEHIVSNGCTCFQLLL